MENENNKLKFTIIWSTCVFVLLLLVGLGITSNKGTSAVVVEPMSTCVVYDTSYTEKKCDNGVVSGNKCCPSDFTYTLGACKKIYFYDIGNPTASQDAAISSCKSFGGIFANNIAGNDGSCIVTSLGDAENVCINDAEMSSGHCCPTGYSWNQNGGYCVKLGYTMTTDGCILVDDSAVGTCYYNSSSQLYFWSTSSTTTGQIMSDIKDETSCYGKNKVSATLKKVDSSGNETEYGTISCKLDYDTTYGGSLCKIETISSVPSGYKGWYNNSSCTGGTIGNSVTLYRSTSGKSYYACQVASDAAGKAYTVTFDSKGGSSIANQTVEEGKKVTKPSDPTRSGYKFAGWTLNGSAYDFDTAVNGNITLVAKWTSISGGTTPTTPGSTPTPSDPSSSSEPSSSSSSSSSKPASSSAVIEQGSSSSTNVEENPPTGEIAIFVVWVIAAAAIVYSVWYFKQVRES